LVAANVTAIGRVHARALELASNSIFDAAAIAPGEDWIAPIVIERKQTGCVRFCWLPLTSLAPRRYRCQPELEVASEIDRAMQRAGDPNHPLSEPTGSRSSAMWRCG